jgi:hypothetical protein
VGFVVEKVTLGQVFPRSISLHRCSITREKTKKLIVFITGLHNKPQGCGASVASAAGLFTTKRKVLPEGTVFVTKDMNNTGVRDVIMQGRHCLEYQENVCEIPQNDKCWYRGVKSREVH